MSSDQRINMVRVLVEIRTMRDTLQRIQKDTAAFCRQTNTGHRVNHAVARLLVALNSEIERLEGKQ